MININFTKTLLAGVALAMAFYPQAWAIWTTKTCDDQNGYACYRCGSKCTATLYQDGRLLVSGTGGIDVEVDGVNGPFSNSVVKPTSLIIQEGITSIRGNAFWKVSSINEIILADSVQTIGWDGIGTKSQVNIVMSDKSRLTNYDSRQEVTINNILCRGDLKECRNSQQENFPNSTFAYYRGLDENGNVIQYHDTGYYKYDSQGNLLESWNFDSTEQYDENGNIIARYTKSGNLLTSYDYASDGSVYIRDANGKLIGAKKTTAFTPAEAAALVKKGNHNTVTLTVK